MPLHLRNPTSRTCLLHYTPYPDLLCHFSAGNSCHSLCGGTNLWSGVRARLVFCRAERLYRGLCRAKGNCIGRHGHALEADPGATRGDSRLLGAGAHGKLRQPLTLFRVF